MALHTKKKFCELVGIATKDLSNYIKRGKVVLSGELIDDEIKENVEFIKKRAELKVKEVIEKSSPANHEHKAASPNYEKIKTYIHENRTEPSDLSIVELEKIKKTLDIDKITEEIEILKKKNEKLAGESIPTDLVKMLFAQYSKSVATSFHTAADNFLMEISKKHDIDREEMAKLRGELIKKINEANHKSIEDSQKMISNIVSEFTAKKQQGEKA